MTIKFILLILVIFKLFKPTKLTVQDNINVTYDIFDSAEIFLSEHLETTSEKHFKIEKHTVDNNQDYSGDFELYESEEYKTQQLLTASVTKPISSVTNWDLLRQIFNTKWIEDSKIRKTQFKEAPQFMTELYKTVAYPDGRIKANSPFNSKVIRCYAEANTTKSNYFYFNISNVDENEFILEAELHVFRLPDLLQIPHPALYATPYCLLKVFQVTDLNMLNISDIHILLNVHYVSAYATGWQIFNVKQAVKSWLSGTKRNLGLLVTATSLFGNDVSISFSRRDVHQNIFQPILVLFNGEKVGYNNDVSSATETSSFPKVLFKKSNTPYETDSKNPLNYCHKQDFYVNFLNIGLNNFILAPLEYNAHICNGHCYFPLNYKTTNHAILRSLLGNFYSIKNTKPCCVPTKLAPILVLYYNNEENVILRKCEEMIVTECGCQ